MIEILEICIASAIFLTIITAEVKFLYGKKHRGGWTPSFFMLQYVQNTFVMDRDKLKLLIRQLEFTLDAIKAEVYSDTDAYKNSHAFEQTSDYDELFDDDDGYPD